MKIRQLSDVPKQKVDMEGAEGAWKQLVISNSDGAPNFSFRVFTVEPGGCTPFHDHESEHLNYVISGQGALVDEKGNEHSIGEGTFAMVEPYEKHRYRNTSGGQNLVLICAVPSQYE
jgi:quercetin dioxygenase-like cupin family protein